MTLQSGCIIGPDSDILVDAASFSRELDVHDLSIPNSKSLSVFQGHMDVPQGDDGAFLQLNRALRPDDGKPRRTCQIAGNPDHGRDPQFDAVPSQDFHLTLRSDRSQNPYLFDGAFGSADGYRLFAGKLAWLGKVFHLGQLTVATEEGFQILL